MECPCKNCICVPVCVSKNIPALLSDCQYIEMWIISGPHTDAKDGVKVRDEYLTFLNRTIKVQTNGMLRTIYEAPWTFSLEVGPKYHDYLDEWKNTIKKHTPGGYAVW